MLKRLSLLLLFFAFAFVRDQLTIFMSIYFCSINLFVCSFEEAFCCDCCSFIIKSWGWVTPPSKIVFSIMFIILCPLPLHINVSSLPVSTKWLTGTLIEDCIESDQLWKSGLIDSIESSSHEWLFPLAFWYSSLVFLRVFVSLFLIDIVYILFDLYLFNIFWMLL